MKPPKLHETSEAVLPFVEAAHTITFQAACDFLFLNAEDLLLQGKSSGIYLVAASTDMSLAETAELASARAGLAGRELFRTVLPGLVEKLVDLKSESQGDYPDDITEEDRATLQGVRMAREMTSGTGEGFADAFEQIMRSPSIVSNWLGSSLIQFADRLLCTQLAATGWSTSRYRAMLQALARLDGLCTPRFRVAAPREGFHPELAFAGDEGFQAMKVEDAANSITMMHMSPAVSDLKLGQDKALSMFIAEYINASTMGERSAYACARHGDKASPEFDVVVPALKLAFEVKLFRGVGSLMPNKLSRRPQELRSQIEQYFDAGYRQVYFVTNVDGDVAASITPDFDDDSRGKVTLVTGQIAGLIAVLKGVIKRLERHQESGLEKRVDLQSVPPRSVIDTDTGGAE